MTIQLSRYGEDYDASLKGSEVLGCMGDFNMPFLANGASDVLAKASFSYVTNFQGATQVIRVSSPQLHYRWRYLNQITDKWSTLSFSPSSTAFLTDSTATQLVTTTGIPLNQGVGDLEYFFTADLDAQYYLVRDYANDSAVGFGADWTEKITAVTNRATYAATDGVPSGGTDYFVRIREGESNMEWVQMVGTLTITNKVAGSNEVVKLVTPDGTVPRMTLVGDHSWRYHYQVPTNAIGGKLSFKLVAKEYYTNATDATTWLVRTNELFTVEETVTDIPYTATLLPSNPNEISVILDDASTHLKIEYNDEQGAFSLSHASYQAFNQWTDAMVGFRGNVMDGNGVSNSGVSDNKKRYDAPFGQGWELCPEQNNYWTEEFTVPVVTNTTEYPISEWFSVHKTPHGWTAHNGAFVEGARGDDSNLALAMDGLGEGALALENFSTAELPLGLASVEFTARIAQPIQYEDFAYYMDGLSCSNYAISAMVTMSRMKETTTAKPTDMSPIYPSVSFVGRHRGTKGCYEFRMTRTSDTELTLALYKWRQTGSGMKSEQLATRKYTANLLVPLSDSEVNGSFRTAAYFLVYTLVDGRVKLEGHLASKHTALGIGVLGSETGLSASSIAYLDENPGVLARGGSYGVGSTDCRAGFGAIRYHEVATPPSSSTATAGDAVLSYPGTLEGRERLADEWNYYSYRWDLETEGYDPNGGLTAVVPTNQVVQVWLQDASISGSGWDDTGYSVAVNSFSTNKFIVSPRIPGSWKVRLQTGMADAGVVVDDVEITPWEGVERWGRKGNSSQYVDDWVYTKAWITTAADITRNNNPYYLPDDCVQPAGTNGYVFIFNEPGTYDFVPTTDMEIDRVLLVGGGGSGGSTMGGGGGGGGVVEGRWESDPVTVPAGTHVSIIVGKGGAAPVPVYSSGNSNLTSQPAGKNGDDSSISGLGRTLATAKGGGGGAGWPGWPSDQKTGGSGGGGANTRAGATGTANQGNAGGTAVSSSNTYGLGGGGGGAGGAGQGGQASTFTGGKGGDGWPSDITGDIRYYGGGGGGGAGWKNTALGGAGGLCGPATSAMTAGHGADYQKESTTLTAGLDGYGGGGGGGTYYNNSSDANVKKGAGARGGNGAVILRVRTASRVCVLQPSRGKVDYPMGLRSPYIDEGMSLFTYSYQNADSNCVLLVQIATNMTPAVETSYVSPLTESLATNGEDVVWTTIARHDFSTMTNKGQLVSGTMTTFISLRQHWIYDIASRKTIYTNVCGLVRVIVDPAIVSNVVNAARNERDDLIDYGKITLTKAYCYNEPALNLRSWFGWNVHTEGWDTMLGPGRFAYLTDWPDGLSIALNFSAKEEDNDTTQTNTGTLGIGLGEPDKATEYAGQNPFIQCAALTNGIGTVSFRARLFNPDGEGEKAGWQPRAVITLYGGMDPSADQPTTEGQLWHMLTNFVVTSPTYQAFEWESKAATSPYQAIRLEAAGARWGRRPAAHAGAWEWGDIPDYVKQDPINRVFIDEVSASELIVPRLKFLDVRPFRTNLGTEEICVITNIMKAEQQPLILESWGLQCRLEPQQMADELDTDSIRVWMEVYRGESPWGYKQWKDLPKDTNMWINGRMANVQQRFTSELQRVSDSNLVFRSYYLIPESIMPPEETPNTVYQYVLRATYRDKSGSPTEYPAVLEAADWVKPEWYRGSTVGAGNDSGDPDQFAAYTILDSISPYRAWINELNLCDAMNTEGLNQFLELAVPQGANLENWNVRFTDYSSKKSAPLFTFGIDEGVRNFTSKTGDRYGVDNTNHYTFVSVCGPNAKDHVANDGYWKSVVTNTVVKNTKTGLGGVFQYQYPYGIQLIRPSGIIEHEIVMQGTNMFPGVFSASFSGTNLVAQLKAADPDSQWFYAGEDLAAADSSLGVYRSHGEEADPSCWTNYMYCTPTEINKLKDGTLQEIPEGYFLEPLGGNVWIYSTLLKPDLLKQFFDGREMGASAVIVVPTGSSTNIVLSVTNWYQIGKCTANNVDVPGAQGQTGTYSLQLNSLSNTVTLLIDAEPDATLASKWGLTPENTYSPAVLAWLFNEYPGCGPDDLSSAIYRDLSGASNIPLTLTEMYWLNIPPVHADPVCGGSNIWFVAGMGSLVSGDEPDVEPHVTPLPDGSLQSNVFMTVTMMITNTSPHLPSDAPRAWPPDRLNGHVYDGQGSAAWSGGPPAWTSAVFNIVGALQMPGIGNQFRVLQQYTFKPGSFGGADDPQHPFQTRIKVEDPFGPNSMGAYYQWSSHRDVYPVWYRWVIKPKPDDARLSTGPLTPNWGTPSVTDP